MIGKDRKVGGVLQFLKNGHQNDKYECGELINNSLYRQRYMCCSMPFKATIFDKLFDIKIKFTKNENPCAFPSRYLER